MAILLVIVLGLWVIFKFRSVREDLRFLNDRVNKLQGKIQGLQKTAEPEQKTELEAEPEPLRPVVAPRPQEPRPPAPPRIIFKPVPPSTPTPDPVPTRVATDSHERARQIFDIEETLGANWLL